MSRSDLPRLNLHYISYGITKTGGYRHEKFFYKAAIKYFRKAQVTKGYYYRKNKLFYHFFAYLELLVWAFFRSGGHINIVTARTGLSAILRNRFSKNEVWIVMHNYDPADNKSGLLNWYYRILFKTLRNAKHKRYKVITVSPFFINYFKEKVGLMQVYLFPNLFDTRFLETFITNKKNKWVHLGQFSSKNDPAIFSLAKRLNDDGYYCYFSTLNRKEAKPHNGKFEIVYFHTFEEYLQHMALCCCTLALTSINEGWPRLTHESLLVGTPVIGYANGGLGDLLRESNSIIVKNTEEAYICIKEALWVLPDRAFIEKYDIANADTYLDMICQSR